eukprot:c28694_g1_i2 orf=130-2562(-)
MGGGRRTQTYVDNSSGASINQFRSLSKRDLAGVIFGCTQATIRECLENQIFGLPATHFAYVRNVSHGMRLFLFNYDDKRLHGVFEAASCGEMNINPYSWTQGGSGRTRFPAQVRVCISRQCQPLPEKVFKESIIDNYYTDSHFSFELDHIQTGLLTSLFKNATYSIAAIGYKNLKPTTALISPKEKRNQTSETRAQQVNSGSDGWLKPKKTSRVVVNDWYSDVDAPITAYEEDSEPGYLASIFECLAVESSDSPPKNYPEQSKLLTQKAKGLDEGSEFLESVPSLDMEDGSAGGLNDAGEMMCEKMAFSASEQSPGKTKERGMILETLTSTDGDDFGRVDKVDHKHLVLEKLEHLTLSQQQEHFPVKGEMETPVPKSDTGNPSIFGWEMAAREKCLQEQVMLMGEREKLFRSLEPWHPSLAKMIQQNLELCAVAIAQVRQDNMELKQSLNEACKRVEQLSELENLQKKNALLEHSQVQMASDIQDLKMEVACLSRQLKTPLRENGETIASTSTCPAMSEVLNLGIYLLGGHNGNSWLGTVDLFYPGTCYVQSVASMAAPRSYAATAVLMDQIYVFGGGNGSSWYNTAEVYDSKANRWTACASLSLRRGSLAGASLGDRIFAIGGGNDKASFSDVECYDPQLGIWIPSTTMLNKRFCVAAVELGGALYAIGGYDGKKYLNSVERFDPRESLWTAVAPMNRKRGSLSAAASNGKIYALGGFDGSAFLNSMEVFDPRGNCWLNVDNGMHRCRAYGATAMVEGTLYAIGGLDGHSYVETVECYREGAGWEILRSAMVGMRCFLASAVLKSTGST